MSLDSSHDVPFPSTIDEVLGERLQPSEAECATQIANSIEAGIHRISPVGGAEPSRRDVHAKATGILKGQLKVHDNIPPR
ncbi:hypothetical protein BGZ65_012129, partial [Modicella reniformis]